MLSSRIPHNDRGLVLLGTRAGGDLSMPLYEPGSGDPLPEQTQTRISKAGKLAAATREMMAVAPQAGARQVGFAIGRCVIAHALDFDAGVLPCSMLLPHASTIDKVVLDVVSASMDVQAADLTAQQYQKIGLPARLAGLGVDMP